MPLPACSCPGAGIPSGATDTFCGGLRSAFMASLRPDHARLRLLVLACSHAGVAAYSPATYPAPKSIDFAGGFTLRLGFLCRLAAPGRVAKGSALAQADRRDFHADLDHQFGCLCIKPRGGDGPGIKDRKSGFRREPSSDRSWF